MSQCTGALVRVKARRDHESQSPTAPQQRISHLKKEFVQVEVCRSLMAKRMRGVPEAGGAYACRPPSGVKLPILAMTRHNGEAILALVIFLGIAIRARGVVHKVRLSAETSAVFEPVPLHCHRSEVFLLLPQRVLLAVGAIERVDIREELLGDRLRDVPRRIPEDRVEPRARLAEYVRKLQLPVKETHLGRDPFGHGTGFLRWVDEGARKRSSLDLLRRPEPACTPEVHRALERTPCRRTEKTLPVHSCPLRRILDR